MHHQIISIIIVCLPLLVTFSGHVCECVCVYSSGNGLIAQLSSSWFASAGPTASEEWQMKEREREGPQHQSGLWFQPVSALLQFKTSSLVCCCRCRCCWCLSNCTWQFSPPAANLLQLWYFFPVSIFSLSGLETFLPNALFLWILAQ